MKKTVKFLTLGLLAAGMFNLTACSSDDDDPVHIEDHESIEQMVVSVTPQQGGETLQYTYTNGEEQGQKITLVKGVPYVFEISAMNAKHDDHYENTISEILEEKEEHFFVYQTDLVNYTFTRADEPTSTRADGTKVGLKVNLTVNEAQTGKKIGFELKHQPTKVNATDNNGLGSSTGGATDIAVKFPIDVVVK